MKYNQKLLKERILELFEKDKIYLNEELSLKDIAQKLEVPIDEVKEAFSDDSLLKKANALFFK